MTVPSEQSRIQYTTDGTSASFPVPFRFLNAAHLQVARQHNDEASILELGVDYSVSGVGNQAGGTITTTTTLPAGDSISIERIVPITQETAYQRNDPFPERAHEQALDKLTMICQMLGGVLGLTPGSVNRALLLGAADTDGKGSYRANGNRISNLGEPKYTTDVARLQDIIERLSGLSADGSGQFVIERLADTVDPENGTNMIGYQGNSLSEYLDATYPSVKNIAALRLVHGRKDFDGVYVSGHTWDGVGGGLFYWIEGGLQDDDGWRHIRAAGGVWVRNLSGFITPEMCGAKGDGVRDDRYELQTAMRASGNGLNLVCRGMYYITKRASALPSNCLWDWYGCQIVGPSTPTSEGDLIVIVDTSDLSRTAENFTWLGGHYRPDHHLDNCVGIVSNFSNITVRDHVYDLRNGQRGMAVQPAIAGTKYKNLVVDNLIGVGDNNAIAKNTFNIDLGGEATIDVVSVSKVLWYGKTKQEGNIRISSGYSGVAIRSLSLVGIDLDGVTTGVTLNGVDGFSITRASMRGVSYRGFEINNSKNGMIQAFVESAEITQASGGAYVEIGNCSNIKTDIVAVSKSASWDYGVHGGGTRGEYKCKFLGAFGTIVNTAAAGGNEFIINALEATGNIINSYRASDVYDIQRIIAGIKVRSAEMDNSGVVVGRANAAPTGGYWVQGSRIYRNNVTSASATGFINTASGAPGAWAATSL